jgi:hypothetical protein
MKTKDHGFDLPVNNNGNHDCLQGDQIRQLFDIWVVVYF